MMRQETKPVTMKDVALAARLSSATISMALRGHTSIPQKTRDRVQQIASELGYSKDPALMALSKQRSNQRVTMQDVASHVGVHQTTVSIALRNRPGIPEATRLKIQEAAIELGYRTDPAIEAFNRHRLNRRYKVVA